MNLKKICFGILCFFCLITVSHAECSYEEQVRLATEASNVNAVYEAGNYGTGEYERGEMPDENGNYEYEITELKVIVNVYNITENMYVLVRNENTNEEDIYYYSDTENGTLTWERTDLDNIVEYTISIYSNNSDCQGNLLRNISLITPRYNDYSTYTYCDGLDVYYCQEFVTTDLGMTEDQIYQDAIKLQQEKEEISEQKSEENTIDWSSIILYGLIAILIVGVVATVWAFLKRRNRVR